MHSISKKDILSTFSSSAFLKIPPQTHTLAVTNSLHQSRKKSLKVALFSCHLLQNGLQYWSKQLYKLGYPCNNFSCCYWIPFVILSEHLLNSPIPFQCWFFGHILYHPQITSSFLFSISASSNGNAKCTQSGTYVPNSF